MNELFLKHEVHKVSLAAFVLLFFMFFVVRLLLHKEQNVQECDATEAQYQCICWVNKTQ